MAKTKTSSGSNKAVRVLLNFALGILTVGIAIIFYAVVVYGIKKAANYSYWVYTIGTDGKVITKNAIEGLDKYMESDDEDMQSGLYFSNVYACGSDDKVILGVGKVLTIGRLILVLVVNVNRVAINDAIVA